MSLRCLPSARPAAVSGPAPTPSGAWIARPAEPFLPAVQRGASFAALLLLPYILVLLVR